MKRKAVSWKANVGDGRGDYWDLSVRSYLRDLRRHKPVSRTEEVELLRRGKAGDRNATEKLISSNLRFVVSIALQHANRGLPLADLIAEGNCGLIRALARFDETQPYKFITYAVWWIRQSILKALNEQVPVVRIPTNRIEDMGRLRQVARGLSQTLGRVPTLREMAVGAGMSLKRAERASDAAPSEVYLDSPIGENGDGSLHDLIPAEGPDPEELFHARSQNLSVLDLVATLPSREAEIITLYFGLEGEPVTLRMIGMQMGVSRERIRQIRDGAMGKLRRKLRVRGLAAA